MDGSQPIPLSVEQCKDVLRMIAKMFCIKTELISTRLLSNDDKKDMLNGLVPIDSLITHVKVWKEYGMCNYSDGSGEPYSMRNA